MPDIELWERFGEVAEPDRSAVLRAFVAWYVREPGAKLPVRPVIRSGRSDHGGRATTVRA
jgi:hypothetical protein